MSPVSMLMIHNPMTLAFGDTAEMKKAISMLSEVKESIINAYELKTNLSRVKISHLMDEESWFNAKKAIEMGFADGILFEKDNKQDDQLEAMMFSKQGIVNSLMSKIPKKKVTNNPGTPIKQLDKRLELIK